MKILDMGENAVQAKRSSYARSQVWARFEKEIDIEYDQGAFSTAPRPASGCRRYKRPNLDCADWSQDCLHDRAESQRLALLPHPLRSAFQCHRLGPSSHLRHAPESLRRVHLVAFQNHAPLLAAGLHVGVYRFWQLPGNSSVGDV